MSVAGLESHMLTTRHHLLHANSLAASKFSSVGHSVLDLHFYVQLQSWDRDPDGIHWMPPIHRIITNLLLTFIAISSNRKLPGRVESFALERINPSSDSDQISRKRKELLMRPEVEMSETVLSKLSSLRAKKLRQPLAAEYKAKVREWRQEKLPTDPSSREEKYFSRLKALYERHKNHPAVPALASIKQASK